MMRCASGGTAMPPDQAAGPSPPLSCAPAGDGAEGLALTHAHRPDLVITDALMPNVTGDELVELLQADPDLRHIPIVMATAAASPVRVRKMLGLGCRAVVAKPLDEETFLAAVRDALLP
jgi:CheY-like chemotaxis protein